MARETDDPIETSLAHALSRAADAGRFDVVVQLAKELEARRLERSQNRPLPAIGSRPPQLTKERT